jgi:hypothetical protein
MLRVDHCGDYEAPEVRLQKRKEKGLKVSEEDEASLVDAKGMILKQLTGEAALGSCQACSSLSAVLQRFTAASLAASGQSNGGRRRNACGRRKPRGGPGRRPRRRKRRARRRNPRMATATVTAILAGAPKVRRCPALVHSLT